VDDDTAGIKVQRRYQYGTGARYELVSNPYRAGTSGAASSEAGMGWTVTTYDTGGRLVSKQYFDDSGLPAPWGSNTNSSGAGTTSYNGYYTTVTDEAGNSRVTQADGLGRMTAVWENPSGLNYETTYSYDALDDLTGVAQGSETRSFSYDSLKRLSAATNPESGTVSYTYDANRNLLTKTDARKTKTTYSYDALNRKLSASWPAASTCASKATLALPPPAPDQQLVPVRSI
jgi:YD repeat-containing protein